LENIQCAFADQELKTFKSLAGLVQDAKNLKIYAATALLNLRECIDTACSAFQVRHTTTTPQPKAFGLPMLPLTHPPACRAWRLGLMWHCTSRGYKAWRPWQAAALEELLPLPGQLMEGPPRASPLPPSSCSWPWTMTKHSMIR
jgi:hypothetical protein